jgi:hypothetical protein
VRPVSGILDAVTADEEQLIRSLQGIQALWVGVCDESHRHLDVLLDPARWHEPSTTNYLTAGAPGTLRDRYFTPENGDRVSPDDVTRVNAEYQELLASATDRRGDKARIACGEGLLTALWPYAAPDTGTSVRSPGGARCQVSRGVASRTGCRPF